MSSILSSSQPAGALVDASSQPPRGISPRQHSYGQILKSSAVIGASSVVNIAFGVVRAKAMALFIGPAGVGLWGLYNSIGDLAYNVAGMGINSSGVRQIAEAVGSGETERIARTAAVLRRTSVFLGVAGAILLALLSRPVSRLTFETDAHTVAVALLSVTVLLRLVAAGQGALIQGLRRISDLALMGMWGALLGTVVSIPVVYFFREQGVAPSLVVVAGMSILTSWWYSRRVEIQTVSVTRAEARREAGALLKLGFAFMASGLLTTGSAYVIRLIVLRKVGFDAAGLYQSAWALGGMYVGFILQAMGADFYPRLTGVNKDNSECNRLVNEQARISLLLAGPGVLGTLTFAPLVIAMFYSTRFGAAVEILRWICLGMTLRVVAWPMGYIVLAKGAQTVFFWTELAAAVVQVGLAWVLVEKFSLAGAGMAFFGLYIWHSFLVYFIVSRMSGFRWSPANRQTGLLYLGCIALVFSGFKLLPFWLATSVGTLVTILSGVYSIRVLTALLPLERVPPTLRRLLSLFGPRPHSGHGCR